MISRKMGGLGSGNWDRFGSKTLVEGCLYLDVNQFNREGWLQTGQWSNLKWTNGANIGVKTMASAIELSYTISRDGQSEQVHYQVALTWTQCNYGGKRPWFICPGEGCGRRVGKLYLDGKPIVNDLSKVDWGFYVYEEIEPVIVWDEEEGVGIEVPQLMSELNLIPRTAQEVEALLNPMNLEAEVERLDSFVNTLSNKITTLEQRVNTLEIEAVSK